jgi:hypothetical protein
VQVPAAEGAAKARPPREAEAGGRAAATVPPGGVRRALFGGRIALSAGGKGNKP